MAWPPAGRQRPGPRLAMKRELDVEGERSADGLVAHVTCTAARRD